MDSVSVIIPVHNSEKYLEQCILSVIEQKISDVELILVENGSTDSSLSICVEYAQKFSQIRYIELDTMGVSRARNVGIKNATKKWITFLDADDMLQPHILEDLDLDLDAEVLITGYNRYYPTLHEDIQYTDINSRLLAGAVLQYAKYRSQLEETPIDNVCNWSACMKYYQRNFLIENDIEFPDGISYSEDTAFCFQVYMAATKVSLANVISYYYRPNQMSVTFKQDRKIKENNLKLIDYFEKYMEKYPTSRTMKSELNSFYTRKVIEALIIDKDNELILEIKKNPIIKKAILNTSFMNLIIGKKNKIIYGINLLKLKKQCFLN